MSYGSMRNGSFDINDEIGKFSQMGMSDADRANHDRRHAASQAELVEGREEAREAGDRFSERDCDLRHQYNANLYKAAAAQDNINRYKDDPVFLKDAQEQLKLYEVRIEEIRIEHDKLVNYASNNPIDRDLNSLDVGRGEDEGKKTAWFHKNREALEQGKKLRASGDAAIKNNDRPTEVDCALRLNHIQARMDGDKEKASKIEAEHKRFQQIAAEKGRHFNGINQVRGEDVAKNAAWILNKGAQEQREELRSSANEAIKTGDRATQVDCALRSNYIQARMDGDKEKVAKIEAEHKRFQEIAAKEGRKFNSIDQVRGEDQEKKSEWERRKTWNDQQQYTRDSEVARQKGDTWEDMDCGLRARHADAKLANDPDQMQRIESVHAAFVEEVKTKTRRQLNGIDLPRGEEPVAKAAWEESQSRARPPAEAPPVRDAAREPDRPRPGFQVRNEKAAAARVVEAAKQHHEQAHQQTQAELEAKRQEAGKIGDTATDLDCTYRLSYNDAEFNGDHDLKQLAAENHASFVERTQEDTGRKFNSIDNPQGEDPVKKDEWNRRQAAPAAEIPDLPNGNKRKRPSKSERDLAKSLEQKKELMARLDQANKSGDRDLQTDCHYRLLHNERGQHKEQGSQNKIAENHQKFVEKVKSQSGREFESILKVAVKYNNDSGPRTPEGRKDWLDKNGFKDHHPEFKRLAAKDENFQTLKRVHEARPKGFEAQVAKSRELAAQQAAPTEEQRRRPPTR